ncbi:MAG: pyrroline-5-carboxylate reductase dimerization domain-containing protein, partial [Pseudomonadota bacterium]
GVGVTGYVLAPACDDADRALVDRLLEPLGLVEGPLREDQMDALTAISGSGPAYVFLMTEAMSAAGRQLGLDDDMAERLARRTVSGAGVLLERSGMDAKSLRKAVTSPNGTTEAALDVLSRGLPNIVREAAEAAARRSADLSRES